MVKSKRPIDVRELTSKVAKDYEKDREYSQNKKFIEFKERQKRYAQSRSGRFSSRISKGLNFLRSPTRSLYSRQIEPRPYSSSGSKTIRRIGTGRRGRPVGTLDQRYAKFGGVYGWRKYQATQLRIQRMEALRRATVNPRQQQVLNQIEARDRYQQQNPENRVIPDSSGTVFMSNIMDEINRATNLVD